jgi:hypothetical protein
VAEPRVRRALAKAHASMEPGEGAVVGGGGSEDSIEVSDYKSTIVMALNDAPDGKTDKDTNACRNR